MTVTQEMVSIRWVTVYESVEIAPASNCKENFSFPPRKNGFHQPVCERENGSVSSDCKVEEPVQESCPSESISELIQILEKDAKNLEAVSEFVQKHKGKRINFENDDDYYLWLCDLNGTNYMGQKFMQKAWEELYLPKITRMQVLGMIENSKVMGSCVEWVILVGEDGCVYAYEEEEMELIAKSLSEFLQHGRRKVYKTYQYPESSDEDNDSVEDDEVLKIRQSAKDFVNENENEFDDFLRFLSS